MLLLQNSVRQTCNRRVGLPVLCSRSSSSSGSDRNVLGKRCHYDVLGVSQTADSGQIKSAFIHMTKTYHPDRRPSDSMAHDRYVQINEAHTILSKIDTRHAYDVEMGYRSIPSDHSSHVYPTPFTPGSYRGYQPPRSYPNPTADASWRSKPDSDFMGDLMHTFAFYSAIVSTLSLSFLIFLLIIASVSNGAKKQFRLASEGVRPRNGLVHTIAEVRRRLSETER